MQKCFVMARFGGEGQGIDYTGLIYVCMSGFARHMRPHLHALISMMWSSPPTTRSSFINQGVLCKPSTRDADHSRQVKHPHFKTPHTNLKTNRLTKALAVLCKISNILKGLNRNMYFLDFFSEKVQGDHPKGG